MYAQNFYIFHEEGVSSLRDFIQINICDESVSELPIKDLAEIIGFHIGEEKTFGWTLGGNLIRRISGWDYRNHEDSKTPPEHIALIETVHALSNEWHELHNDIIGNDDWAKIDDLVAKYDMLLDDDHIALGDNDFYSYPDYETLQAFHADLKGLVDAKKAKG